MVGTFQVHTSNVIELGDGQFSQEIDATVLAVRLAEAAGGKVYPVIENRPYTLLSTGLQDPDPTGDVKAFAKRMSECLRYCHQGKRWPAQTTLLRAMRHGFVSFDTAYHLSETLAAAMAGEPVPASSARDAALKAWETIRRNRATA